MNTSQRVFSAAGKRRAPKATLGHYDKHVQRPAAPDAGLEQARLERLLCPRFTKYLRLVDDVVDRTGIFERNL